MVLNEHKQKMYHVEYAAKTAKSTLSTSKFLAPTAVDGEKKLSGAKAASESIQLSAARLYSLIKRIKSYSWC